MSQPGTAMALVRRSNAVRRRLLLGVVPLLVLLLAPALPASAATITSVPVVSGLARPDALAIAPDGRIFIGEQKTGRILLRQPNRSLGTFFTVPQNRDLYGLTVHPKFPATPYVYGYGTRVVKGAVRLQLWRLRMSGAKGTNLTVLHDFGPEPSDHAGGPLLFGPDGRLYLMIGDGADSANSQALSTPYGKVLRMTATGGVPTDNPLRNRVWAYGLRNSFGLAFDPATNNLWETENGPECNDELNLISRDANYGWGPTETCSTPPDAPANTNQDGPSPTLPKTWYAATTAPTGATFCFGCGLGSGVEGRLVYATYKTHELRAVTLGGSSRNTVVSETLLLAHSDAITAVQRGPKGTIWFTDGTSLRRVTLS